MSNRITLTDYCTLYSIDTEFILEIEHYEIMTFDREASAIIILHEQLSELDRIRQLRYDLNINMEGIDVIRRLLEKQSHLLEQKRQLEQELKLYR